MISEYKWALAIERRLNHAWYLHCYWRIFNEVAKDIIQYRNRYLAVRFGSKVLELAKGKNAVELSSGDELIAALHALKTAALAGELDVQIEAASGALRAGYVK